MPAGRVHLIAGGFPLGSYAGHDHDYARLQAAGFADRTRHAGLGGQRLRRRRKMAAGEPAADHLCRRPVPRRRSVPRRSSLARGRRTLARRCTAPAAAAPSGSRARHRRTVKMEHHALLGSYFLTHPPIRGDPRRGARPRLAADPGARHLVRRRGRAVFHRAAGPRGDPILLTADYGAGGDWPVARHPVRVRHLAAARRPTRVSAISKRSAGAGRVFCARPLPQPGDPRDPQPRSLGQDAAAVSWLVGHRAFTTLLRNAIAWGVGR